MTSTAYAAYPLLNEHMIDDTPVWEHDSRIQAERAAAELREQNKRLGESITWILSILQPKEDAKGEDAEKVLVQRKEALESLTYVRDVLGGEIKVPIDERRLWGAEEYDKRLEGQSKQFQESQEPPASQPRPRSMTTALVPSATSTASEYPPAPPPPPPVRHLSSNASMSGSLRPPTSPPPLQSSSIPSRTNTTHNRSHSSNSAFHIRPATMLRTPLRLSSSNPFQRTPDAGRIPPAAVPERITTDQTPKVRSEVQHDPLGVLK
jgi:TBC1 domain family protein 5